MKNIILSIVLALASFPALAQAYDTIVFRDGTAVEAKVTAVNTDNVEYYRADNINEPKFTIQKDRIAHIVFSNGHKEVFNKVDGGIQPGGASPERDMDNYRTNGNIGSLAGKASTRYVKTEEEMLEMSRRKKKFYGGIVVGGGLSCSDLVGTTEGAGEYYRNSAGFALDFGVTFDYYLKENSSWYIGGAIETVLEEPRMKASVSNVTVITKMFNKDCLFSVHAGQHFFPQKRYGYGNFYWKAGIAAGFSFKAEGIIVLKANGEREKQTVSEASRLGFQVRPVIEAGIGAYSAKIGIRYSPSITPMINIGGTDKSVHNISIVLTTVF
ncbi:MAG: hypothetical protein NC115_12700 [Bacteroidales bacterium]|nr:hypothetical protein [Bacteroidales bacterium]